MKKFFSILFLCFFVFEYFFSQSIYAVEVSVEAPTDILKEGDTFDFKINIDTQGESVSKQEFYVTYDSQYVQFQDGGFLAGDFFDSTSYSKIEDGKLYVLAESTTPKSGSGLIAIVKLKIIATAPGSTTLCAIAPIESSPTPIPTTPDVPTAAPTALPKTGAENDLMVYSAIGLSCFLLAAAIRKMVL
jgi:LPXTG-motif cell wall-anchored protein